MHALIKCLLNFSNFKHFVFLLILITKPQKEIRENSGGFVGITICLRQLHRLLRQESLFRRHNMNILIDNVQGSNNCIGYRFMHLNLRNLTMAVDREMVRICIKILDPGGVKTVLRSSRAKLSVAY